MKTPYQPKKNLILLATKGGIKKVENNSNRVRKNISLSSAFVNFPSNMSYTLALGSKGAHTIFSMWGPKMSNNNHKLTKFYSKYMFLESFLFFNWKIKVKHGCDTNDNNYLLF